MLFTNELSLVGGSVGSCDNDDDDDGDGDGDGDGVISLCIWGISPTLFVSLPQQNCFISPTT